MLEIIDLIKNNGSLIKLYTTLFYKDCHLIDEICISCYGDDKINNYITKSIYKPFNLIRQYKDRNILPTIHIVPMSINIDTIENTIKTCLELGIRKIKILKLVVQGRCINKFIPNRNKLIALYEKFNNTPEVNFGFPFKHECIAGREKIVLLSNGNIIPCETYKDGFCKCEKLF